MDINVNDDHRVRILTIEGKISHRNYILEAEKPDRKGLVTVIDPQTGSQIKVNHKRILRGCNEDEALVLTFGERHRAVCARCAFLAEVVPGNEWLECPVHGLVKLCWKEGKLPMSGNVNAVAKAEELKKEVPAKAKVKSAPEIKPTRIDKSAASAIDFNGLVKTNELELWTKKNIQFDHAKMDVRAHVLLFVGDSPRKMCFNSYDGVAGKNKTLPIEAFISGKTTSDKKLWYDVKDLEATRKKLTATGYELHKS
jgi:hypothetical protein